MDVRVGPYRKLSAKELMLWNLMLEKTLESPLDSKEIQPVHPKGNQFSSVTQSCPTLCDPMNRSTPGLPAITNCRSLPKPMSIELVMPSNYLILCRLLLLLPSLFLSIRVFSNESVLPIRWPKYWSFSFSISPSSE